MITISSDKASVVEEDAVRPVLFLRSSAKITGESGTSTNPYQIATPEQFGLMMYNNSTSYHYIITNDIDLNG